jgi:hypothetical protein
MASLVTTLVIACGRANSADLPQVNEQIHPFAWDEPASDVAEPANVSYGNGGWQGCPLRSQLAR